MRRPQKTNWKPPWRCRIFNHKWEDTGIVAFSFYVLNSNLEVCSRCKGGRVFQLGGFRNYIPSAVQTFLNEQAAEKKGELIRIEDRRPI